MNNDVCDKIIMGDYKCLYDYPGTPVVQTSKNKPLQKLTCNFFTDCSVELVQKEECYYAIQQSYMGCDIAVAMAQR